MAEKQNDNTESVKPFWISHKQSLTQHAYITSIPSWLKTSAPTYLKYVMLKLRIIEKYTKLRLENSTIDILNGKVATELSHLFIYYGLLVPCWLVLVSFTFAFVDKHF